MAASPVPATALMSLLLMLMVRAGLPLSLTSAIARTPAPTTEPLMVLPETVPMPVPPPEMKTFTAWLRPLLKVCGLPPVPMTSKLRVAESRAARSMPELPTTAALPVNELPVMSTVTWLFSSACALSCDAWFWVKLLSMTLKVMVALLPSRLAPLTKKPSCPSAVLMVEFSRLIVDEPWTFSINALRVNEPTIDTLLKVLVPSRFRNWTPFSRFSLPMLLRSELTSEKLVTKLPLMPFCALPLIVRLVRLTPVTVSR